MTFSSSAKGKGRVGDQAPNDEQYNYNYGAGSSATQRSPTLDSEGSNSGCSNDSNNDTCADPFLVPVGNSPFSAAPPRQNVPEGEGSTMQSSYPVCHYPEQCPYYPDGGCRYCWVPPAAGPSSSRYIPEQTYPYPPPRLVSPRSRSSAPRRHICPICGHAFSKRYDLKRHYQTHVPEIDRPHYACPDCPQKFYRSDSIARHQRSQACKKDKDKDHDKEPKKRA